MPDETVLPESDRVVMPKDSTCLCGNRMPWHLFTLGLGMQHVCSCERLYKQEGDAVKLIGSARNPIAEWDRSHVWDATARSEFGTKGAWVQKT